MATPGGPHFQPESLAELTRFVQYMFSGIEKQLTQVSSKLDKLDVVTREQHREDMDDLREEVKELEVQLEKQRTQASADLETFKTKLTNQNRWLVGSVLFPVAGLILTIYAMLQGVV